MTEPVARIAIAGVSHHTADVIALENFRFGDEPAFLEAAARRFSGVLLLQTCNRVEVIVEGDAGTLRDFLDGQGRSGFFLLEGRDALRHLLSLAAGIESMIVGEDQIIGQLQEGARRCRGSRHREQFSRTLHQQGAYTWESGTETHADQPGCRLGRVCRRPPRRVRAGMLEGRHILVIGSGEMGLLVAQALAAKHLTAMYVANRTYGRAVRLAEKIGGKAVRFNERYHYITLDVVVISCTSAPHPVIHKLELKEAMRDRCWPVEGHPRPLILIDIAQPRDVEEGAGSIDGVRLFTMDNLREVNEQTMSTRRAEAERAEAYVSEELDLFIRQLHWRAADDCIAALHRLGGGSPGARAGQGACPARRGRWEDR